MEPTISHVFFFQKLAHRITRLRNRECPCLSYALLPKSTVIGDKELVVECDWKRETSR